MRAAVSARPASLLVGGLLAASGLLAGCSGDPDPSASPSTSSSTSPSTSATTSAAPSPSTSLSASGSPSPTVTATSSPTPTSATPTATPSTSPTVLVDRLLPAPDVPGLHPGASWAPGTVGPESPSSSFGTCQRFSTLAIGAERALVRRYRPVGAAAGDRAGELVAQLPDALTARRAYAVLTAWHDRCAQRLSRYTRPTVGAVQAVAVPGGTAGWYLLGYGPVPGRPGARYADAQGMAVVGDRLAMVSLRTVGSPATLRTAMPRTLRSAAGRLR